MRLRGHRVGVLRHAMTNGAVALQDFRSTESPQWQPGTSQLTEFPEFRPADAAQVQNVATVAMAQAPPEGQVPYESDPTPPVGSTEVPSLADRLTQTATPVENVQPEVLGPDFTSPQNIAELSAAAAGLATPAERV